MLAIAEDPVNPNLIFVGTEYGLFFTTNGGTKWTRLRNGLPTIAVRDLHIQKPMGDLVIGTFGRSIWVLDDYTPLRDAAPEKLAEKNATIFPVRDAYMYSNVLAIWRRRKGAPGRATLHGGESSGGRADHVLREDGAADEAREASSG